MPRPLAPEVLAATAGDHDAVSGHILDAALRVIAQHGLAAASTRAIAEEAGVAAGTLYNYFDDRHHLVGLAIFRRAHLAVAALGDLPERAGTDSVVANLRWFARRLAVALDELVPLFAAAFSDVDLLRELHGEMRIGHGLDLPVAGRAVERYLVAERALGRVAPGADCAAAASLVVAVCHDRAFQRFFHGGPGRTGSLAGEIDLIAHAVTTPRRP